MAGHDDDEDGEAWLRGQAEEPGSPSTQGTPKKKKRPGARPVQRGAVRRGTTVGGGGGDETPPDMPQRQGSVFQVQKQPARDDADADIPDSSGRRGSTAVWFRDPWWTQMSRKKRAAIVAVCAAARVCGHAGRCLLVCKEETSARELVFRAERVRRSNISAVAREGWPGSGMLKPAAGRKGKNQREQRAIVTTLTGTHGQEEPEATFHVPLFSFSATAAVDHDGVHAAHCGIVEFTAAVVQEADKLWRALPMPLPAPIAIAGRAFGRVCAAVGASAPAAVQRLATRAQGGREGGGVPQRADVLCSELVLAPDHVLETASHFVGITRRAVESLGGCVLHCSGLTFCAAFLRLPTAGRGTQGQGPTAVPAVAAALEILRLVGAARHCPANESFSLLGVATGIARGVFCDGMAEKGPASVPCGPVGGKCVERAVALAHVAAQKRESFVVDASIAHEVGMDSLRVVVTQRASTDRTPECYAVPGVPYFSIPSEPRSPAAALPRAAPATPTSPTSPPLTPISPGSPVAGTDPAVSAPLRPPQRLLTAWGLSPMAFEQPVGCVVVHAEVPEEATQRWGPLLRGDTSATILGVQPDGKSRAKGSVGCLCVLRGRGSCISETLQAHSKEHGPPLIADIGEDPEEEPTHKGVSVIMSGDASWASLRPVVPAALRWLRAALFQGAASCTAIRAAGISGASMLEVRVCVACLRISPADRTTQADTGAGEEAVDAASRHILLSNAAAFMHNTGAAAGVEVISAIGGEIMATAAEDCAVELLRSLLATSRWAGEEGCECAAGMSCSNGVRGGVGGAWTLVSGALETSRALVAESTGRSGCGALICDSAAIAVKKQGDMAASLGIEIKKVTKIAYSASCHPEAPLSDRPQEKWARGGERQPHPPPGQPRSARPPSAQPTSPSARQPAPPKARPGTGSPRR